MVDVAAAMRCWAYEVTFPGVYDETGQLRVFRIEPRPASDWIMATLQPEHESYLPGLLDEDQHWALMAALEDGLITMDDLVETNRDALEQMSGWRWWSAAKLIVTMGTQWETIGGLLVLAGVDPEVKSLGAVLAALYSRIWVDSSTKDRAKLAQDVAAPPASMLDKDNWDEDAATAAVEAFIRAGSTGVRE